MTYKKEWRTGKTSAQRGYNYKWRKERAKWLKKHPLCVYCMDQNIISPAVVVDHIKPHNGDKTLFWSRDNWQSLCKLHHNSTKQREERTCKKRIITGLDGYPIINYE